MLPTPCSLNALDPLPKLGAKVVKLAPPAPAAPKPRDDWRCATTSDAYSPAAFELVHESPRTPLEKAVDDFLVHQAAQMRKEFVFDLPKEDVDKLCAEAASGKLWRWKP